MKNDIVKLGVILFIITAAAGLILSFSNSLTKDIIKKADEAERSGPMVADTVVPGSVSIEEFDKELVEKIKFENEKLTDIRACKDEKGNILGYGITSKSPVKGYNGDIEIILGISVQGEITGMKVTSHSETVGLGTGIEKPKFQDQFIGKEADEQFIISKSAAKENDVEAIGGATFSSKSFVSAVNNAVKIYNEYLKK